MKKNRKLTVLKVLLMLTVYSIAIFAAPTGGVVKSGNANIKQIGNNTNINQFSDKATINWNSFDISKSESVNFNQPSSSSITLNRVIGTSNSLIEGAMNANGQVILINPNGIVFSNGAQINVNGFTGSTLDISEEDFIKGNYKFQGNSQNSILNLGTIKASNKSYVALLGKEIINEGVIEAQMGTIQLASGKKITLNLNGNSLLSLAIDEGMADSLIKNKSLIKADGGKVFITTKAVNNILNTQIINEGTIQAQSLDDITGHVEIFAHGGTTTIGGNIKAKDGFVETSGRKFTINEDAIIKAAKWLIDPVDITIDSILASAIETALGSGHVTIETDQSDYSDIDTTPYESAASVGDIIVDSDITWSSGNTLTLDADNDIFINANIDASGGSGGKLILKYGQSAPALSNTAEYSLDSGVKVNLQGSIADANSNFQTQLGNDGALTYWTVITSLGAEGSLTGTDLQGISYNNAGHYVFGSNIDASATGTWTSGFLPIGIIYDSGSGTYSRIIFNGTIDGLGHAITDMTINASSAFNNHGVGLVATNNGTIKNMTLYTTSPFNTNFDRTGGITGRNLASGLVLNTLFNDTTQIYSVEVGRGKLVGENSGTIIYSYPTIGVDVVYTLSDIIKTYAGTQYLSDFWSTADIFDSAYSSWVYGVDYIFESSGSPISFVKDVGSYNNITVNVKKPGYNEAATGNTVGNVTINKANLTVTANDDSMTYSGNPYASNNGVSYNGFVAGETSSVLSGSLTYGGDSQTAVDAGNYTITASGLSSNNYNISFSDGTLTINKAALSITANNDSKDYDGVAYSGNNGVVYSGFVNGETQTVLNGTLNVAGDSQGAIDAGTYALTPSGLSSNNYNISFNNGTLTINKIPLTITANDVTKTYDGKVYDYSDGVSYSGFVNSEDKSVLGGTVSYTGAGKDVGNYTITPSGLTSNNYNISYNNGTLVVNKAPLTITANDIEKTYDGKVYDGEKTVTYNGLVNNENASVLSGTLSFDGTHKDAINVGNYSVEPSGLSSNNYSITYNNGSLTINKAPLLITANDIEKTYDGKVYDGEKTVVYDGFVNNETKEMLSGSLSFEGNHKDAKDAGTYTVQPTGLESNNYEISYTNGTLIINKADLTITASNDSKIYDGLAYLGGNGLEFSGFVENENETNLNGELSFIGDSQGAINAGSYTITPSGLNSQNYEITFIAGNLIIDKAPLSITAINDSKVFDGEEYLGGNGVIYSGFKNNDSENSLVGDLSYTGDSQGAILPGEYTIIPTGLSSNNYTVSYNGAVLTIEQNSGKTIDEIIDSVGNTSPDGNIIIPIVDNPLNIIVSNDIDTSNITIDDVGLNIYSSIQSIGDISYLSRYTMYLPDDENIAPDVITPVDDIKSAQTNVPTQVKLKNQEVNSYVDNDIKEKGYDIYKAYKKGYFGESLYDLIDRYFEIKERLKILKVEIKVAKTEEERVALNKELAILKYSIDKEIFKRIITMKNSKTTLESALNVASMSLNKKEEVFRHFLKLMSLTKEKGE
jgi:filamentous hemagglutinin family protein